MTNQERAQGYADFFAEHPEFEGKVIGLSPYDLEVHVCRVKVPTHATIRDTTDDHFHFYWEVDGVTVHELLPRAEGVA